MKEPLKEFKVAKPCAAGWLETALAKPPIGLIVETKDDIKCSFDGACWYSDNKQISPPEFWRVIR